jgi:enoyl-CoA hydratase/carnithine racemase
MTAGWPKVEDEDDIRWVTFDRPEVLNALDVEDLELVASAVADPGPAVRAVVLTGAGDRSFSTGMHKSTFTGASPTRARELIATIGSALHAVRTCSVPTVAMVNGFCLGAAFEMVLSCDLRVARRDALLGLPEVKLGIPSVLDAALLRHYVGLSKAKEMILTGDLYSVADLEPFGLVNRIAGPTTLREEVLGLLQKLAPLTREVLAAQKGLFETWMNTSLQESVQRSIEVFAQTFESPATLEALDNYQPDGRRSGQRS